VGFALGPCPAPRISDMAMITAITTHAIAPSLATAYGKNGLPLAFRIEYSRRYCSFLPPVHEWPPRRACRLSVAHGLYTSCLVELGPLLGLEPRWRGRAELRHEIQVSADQCGDQPRNDQHVNRVEAGEGGRAEFRSRSEEVAQVRADQRTGCGDVVCDDGRPVRALVERQQVARERHHHGEDQQHHTDHPIELARVLVRRRTGTCAPCEGTPAPPSRSRPTGACRARTGRGTRRW